MALFVVTLCYCCGVKGTYFMTERWLFVELKRSIGGLYSFYLISGVDVLMSAGDQ